MKRIGLLLLLIGSTVCLSPLSSLYNETATKIRHFYCDNGEIFSIYKPCKLDRCKQLGCQHSCDTLQIKSLQDFADVSNFVCDCPAGHSLRNGTHCERILGCRQPNGIPYCTQLCRDSLVGGNVSDCQCHPGYQLQPDGRSCIAENASAILYYAIGDEIRAYELKTGKQFTVVTAPESSRIQNSTQSITEVERMHGWLFYVLATVPPLPKTQEKSWKNPYHLSYDMLHDQYAERNAQYAIYRVDLDDDHQVRRHSKLLLTEWMRQIYGIAVDWFQSRLYIAERRRILACNIEPFYCRTLPLSAQLDARRKMEIVLSPLLDSMILVSNFPSMRVIGAVAEFYSAPLNGTKLEAGINNTSSDADSFSLDPTGHWLMWQDDRHRLRYCNIQHRQCGMVGGVENVGYHSIGFYEHTLYYVNWKNQTIEACPLTDENQCKQRRTLIEFNSDEETCKNCSLGPISIYYGAQHQKTIDTVRNPCASAGCSHFCFAWNVSAASDSAGYNCACPDGMQMESDGKTCRPEQTEQFLLLSTGGRILKLFQDRAHSDTFLAQEVAIFDERLAFMNYQYVPVIEALAFNFDRSELYILWLNHEISFDTHGSYRQITALNASLPVPVNDDDKQLIDNIPDWLGRMLVNASLLDVRAMVYDVNTDLLYWIDAARGTLDAVSTSFNTISRVTLRNDLENPISLTLDAVHRRWFIGLRDSSQIIALDMDGSDRRLIVSGSNGFANTMTIINAGQDLFWANSTRETLNSLRATSEMAPSSPILSRNTSSWLYENLVLPPGKGSVAFHSLTSLNDSVLYWINAGSIVYLNPSADGDGADSLRYVSIYMLLGFESDQVEPSETRLISGERQPMLHAECQIGRHLCTPPALCLLNAKPRGHSCACPIGFRLQSDEISCEKQANFTEYSAKQAEEEEEDARQAQTAWEQHEIFSYRLMMRAKKDELYPLRRYYHSRRLTSNIRRTSRLVTGWYLGTVKPIESSLNDTQHPSASKQIKLAASDAKGTETKSVIRIATSVIVFIVICALITAILVVIHRTTRPYHAAISPYFNWARNVLRLCQSRPTVTAINLDNSSSFAFANDEA